MYGMSKQRCVKTLSICHQYMLRKNATEILITDRHTHIRVKQYTPSPSKRLLKKFHIFLISVFESF